MYDFDRSESQLYYDSQIIKLVEKLLELYKSNGTF